MNRKVLASALTASVLCGTPVAIAVADENETSRTTDTYSHTAKQQHAELVKQRVQSQKAIKKAERKERAEKRAKKRAKLRKKRAAQAQVQAQANATAAAPAPQQSGGSTASAGLESIAACESGGDPSAVSANGQYRGKYQFDQATWQSVGGSGDPAAAPEAEQDQRAAMLQARAGSSPWPVCGG